jgi:hypothetical protein
VGFLARLLLGNGTLKPELKAELDSEGLVLIEEGLGGSVRYKRFKAPGRRFRGKITGERIGLGISEKRIVAFCRSGRVKLMNSEWTSAHLSMLDVSLEGDDRAVFRIDYDSGDDPKFSGEIAIHVKTPNAARIVNEVRARLGR